MHENLLERSLRLGRTFSVVFSFRNEEAVLPELISRVRAVFAKEMASRRVAEYEMIFVNDASTDRSLDIILDHARGRRDIRVVNMSRRFGVAPCVMAGFSYAAGDAIIYMDADLQDPPEVISQMIDKWVTDPEVDVVHTVRRSREGEGSVKMALTRLGYFILNKFSSVDIPQEAGDFKLLSRKVVEHMISLQENRPFIRGIVCWVGFKQAFIEYDRKPRFAGDTKFPVLSRKVLSNFFGSALISFSAAPLKASIIFGALAIFLDLLLFMHVISEKIQGRAIPGWTAIMISVLFMGGIQLFCLGIIGLYIDSIHEQVRNRPNYIVASTYGFINKENEAFPQKERAGYKS